MFASGIGHASRVAFAASYPCKHDNHAGITASTVTASCLSQSWCNIANYVGSERRGSLALALEEAGLDNQVRRLQGLFSGNFPKSLLGNVSVWVG